jgi:hypothetical protein
MNMIKWLGTTSVALTLGAGVVIAQAQGPGPAQKREETPRVQAPASKDAERPTPGDKGADRSQERAQQPDSKASAKDERRQAEEPTARDSKQPTEQSRDQRERTPSGAAGSAQQTQDQKSRDSRQPAEQKQQTQDQRDRTPSSTSAPTQQSQDQKGRESKQPSDQKQQQTRDEQRKQDNRTGQTGQPTDSRQQQGAGQQPAQTQQGQQQPGTGQASDQTQRRDGTSVSANINTDQRTQIIDRLQRERSEARTNVNIEVNIGARLPGNVRGRPLPADIVQIVPQYRGYEYMVVRDEIVIIEPGRREIVDVISRSSSGGMASARVGSDRVVISSEQRDTLKRTVLRTTGSTQSSGALDASCLQLQALPEELARDNPQLSSYRMLRVGDQIILIDPEQRKVVEVVD